MNNSRLIREYLATRPEGASRPEIQKAVGLTRLQVATSLTDMVKSGTLIRSGKMRHYRFTLGRAPIRQKCHTLFERMQARKERDRKYYARAAERKRERYWAGREHEREQMLAKKAQKLAEQQDKQQAKAAREAARKNEMRRKQRAVLAKARQAEDKRRAQQQAVLAKLAAKASRTVKVVEVDDRPVETVEQFLARGGAVQVLSMTHPWTRSELKGHRAANQAAWNARAA